MNEAFAWIEGPDGEMLVVGDVEVEPGLLLGPELLVPAAKLWLPPDVDLTVRPGDMLNVLLKEEE